MQPHHQCDPPASFEYTDKILENWKTGNVRTLADVERLDSAFEQEKDRKKTPSGQNRTPSAQQPSKFRNFEERSYNMDELTKNYYAVTKKGEHCAVN